LSCTVLHVDKFCFERAIWLYGRKFHPEIYATQA
jgi:hypothetical protein